MEIKHMENLSEKKVYADFVKAPMAKKGDPVVIVDFKMPMGSMVEFMVKWAIASIPALLILFGLFLVLGMVFGGLFAGLR
jgi:hypothetical protein